MIDVKISVNNVDYEAALDTLLPVLLEHLSKNLRTLFWLPSCRRPKVFRQ